MFLFLVLFLFGICTSRSNALTNISFTNSSEFKCPSVFVLPEDLSDSRLNYVDGTNCAEKCKSSIWTNNEWDILETLMTIVLCIGMPLDIIVILTFSLNKEKRSQYFVLYFGLCSFIAQIARVPALFYTFEQVHCKNNAVPIGYKDGLALCNVQSFMFLYGCIGGCMCWMLQSIDLYLKVVLKITCTRKYKKLNRCIIFGIPFIVIIAAGLSKQYGYQPGSSICLLGGIYSTYLAYLPVFIFLTVGAGAVFSVTYVILRQTVHKRKKTTDEDGSTRSGTDAFKVVKGSFLFVLSFLLLIVPVEGYRLYSYMYLHQGATFPVADIDSWAHCIFSHYDGINDHSWIPACGVHPPKRIPFFLACLHGIDAYGSALLISSTYLSQPSVWKVWRRWTHMGYHKLSLSNRKTSSFFTRRNHGPVPQRRTISFKQKNVLLSAIKQSTNDGVVQCSDVDRDLISNDDPPQQTGEPQTGKIYLDNNLNTNFDQSDLLETSENDQDQDEQSYLVSAPPLRRMLSRKQSSVPRLNTIQEKEENSSFFVCE